MLIPFFLTFENAPLTGATPTLTIYNIGTGTIVSSWLALSEVGGGWYKYEQNPYDNSIVYAYTVDAGASYGQERYYYTTSYGLLSDPRLDQMYLNISSLAMKSRESNSSLRKIIEKLADEVEKLPREFSNSQVLNAIENIKFPEFTLKAEDIIEKIVPEIVGVKTGVSTIEKKVDALMNEPEDPKEEEAINFILAEKAEKEAEKKKKEDDDEIILEKIAKIEEEMKLAKIQENEDMDKNISASLEKIEKELQSMKEQEEREMEEEKKRIDEQIAELEAKKKSLTK